MKLLDLCEINVNDVLKVAECVPSVNSEGQNSPVGHNLNVSVLYVVNIFKINLLHYLNVYLYNSLYITLFNCKLLVFYKYFVFLRPDF